MVFECLKCGEPSSEEGLCRRCTLQSAKLLSCPNLVEVTICSVCGARLERGKWKITNAERDIEEQASEAVCNSVCVHEDFKDPKIDVHLSNRGSTRYLARVTLNGNFMGESLVERCEIPVRIKRVACERCSRVAGKYFESTVQVRGSISRPLTDREMEECRRMALSMADAGYRSGDQLSFVQDIKDVKGGIDIILGSTQLGRHIARAIYERFGGKLNESSKLVGKKDGRDVYRSTILVRFPRLKRGDIVSFQGRLFEVTGFDGKRTQITSLENVRRSSLDEDDASKVEILGNKSGALRAVVVAKDEKVLEVMDPESYKTAFASRPRDLQVEPGEEVKVIRTVKGLVVVG